MTGHACTGGGPDIKTDELTAVKFFCQIFPHQNCNNYFFERNVELRINVEKFQLSRSG
jgi:hypothetical protein